MKISYNPKSSQTAITTETAANDDIIFDLYTSKLWAKGVRIGADWADISSKPSSLPANGGNADTVDNLHASDFVRAYRTDNNNIDSDWGQSFKTFDPIPSGTPPEQCPNISLLSISEQFNRRKQLAFPYSNDNIYYRRHIDGKFTNWVKLLHSGNSSISNSTITINGRSITVSKSDHTHSIYAVNENYGGFKKEERLPTSGFYQSYISEKDESGGNAPFKSWTHLINCQHNNTANNYALQIAAGFFNNNTFKIRVTNDDVDNVWRDIIHSGNIGSQTVYSANKWTTARTFTIGNTAKNVDGSGNVSWSLAEIGVRDTWRTVQVNSTSIGNNTLNLCGSTYIGLTNVDGKVTFSLVGSSTTANQAILSNGTANGWTLKTLNIDNWNTAYNFVSTITGTDTDNVINKWDEIVNFLAGITEDNKLNTLLNSKLSIQQLSAKDILTTKTNNALFWVDTIGTAGSITTGPFTDHPYALLSVTNCNQTTKDGKYFYRSRLAFNSVGDLKVASCHYERKEGQDDTWYNVLTSKNSGISGSTIKLNGTSITVYSSGTADGRYVKKSGDTMTGALNFANYIWNQVGDDVAIGDHNIAGCLGIKGLTGNPGLAFYNASNTLLSKLVGTTSQFQRVSGDNTYTIIDTASPYITHGVYVFGRSEIGTSPNYDNPGKNGLFEIRGSSEVTGETGTRPGAGFGPFLNLKTPDNIAMLQIAGLGNTLYFRTNQAGNVTMARIPWKKVLDTGNSYVKDGKGVINGSTITLVDKATIASKVTNSLTLRANGTTLATYDGSSAKEANFTYANVGAASASHNHDGRYVRRWNGVYGSANKFLKLVISDEKGWVRLEVSDSNNALTAGYGIYMIGWSWHGQDNTDKLIVNCLYANDSRYTTALKVVRTSRNNYDFYFQFASGSSYPSYTINYGISIDSIDYTVTEVSTIPTATWTSSLVALQLNASSATSATKVIVNQHTTNDVNYPLVWSNQSNTSNVTENQLYKSWQDLHYNPKNKRLFVGGSVSTAYINATGTVTSAGFKHSAVTKNANQYVLTADGGYTFLNQTSNELAHEFDVNITVTSEWTDIKDFYGGNQSFLTQPGTYIVQVYYKDASADGMYEGYFSGIMSWYTGKTNSNNADEIVLHRVGHAYANTIYLRTRESLSSEENPYTKLQISANSDLKQHTYKFKFKRIC